MKTQIRKTMLCLAALLACCNVAFAQMMESVTWTQELKMVSDTEAELIFNATIEEGWHLYTTDVPENGPMPAALRVDVMEGVELVGSLQGVGEVHTEFDEMFEMEISFFSNSAQFVQRVKFSDPENYRFEGLFEGQTCTSGACMPVECPFSYSKGAAAATEAPAEDSAIANPLWTPVIEQLNAAGNAAADAAAGNQSLWAIFLAGFVGGLVALFTPCVWPIIPMTVSFFLKRSKDRSQGIRDAVLYGIFIIVIYVTLGLLVTLIFGASALNALSTNAIFNIIFFLMLVVFAASFFGAFEITLPASWSNAMDSKAEKTTGLLSIFFMAFTLALVSFSCTGPIIGFLLVEISTTGSIIAPTMGMFGFAVALALPFTLFALFPSMLKSAPRSGGWMNSIKVVLGFIELALSLKFLSVADLAYGWGLLNRPTFLALWIVIFASLGFYLVGKLKFPHDDDLPYVSVPRYFLAMISFAFAIYMVPGLWGAPCKAVSAFAPPMYTQDFSLYVDEVEAEYHDYDQGMQAALQMGKPVLVDFTGYGCVNCREMEASVWTDDKVRDIMREDFVLVSLYVDDKTPLAVPMEVVENGQKRTLKTVGDKWSFLQRYKFGANAQPFYVILDNEGNPLSGSYAFDKDVEHFLEFLNTGRENY
ncbi:MAG: thiol:disulfide interchange protein [Bacteroidales bacterium]|nr:thiol:disulfide interchange protein [Bacteroidales bacterium]